MNIIYTSGTTGPAKGAVLPQAFPIEQARIKIEQWGLTADDVMFSALPLYHVNARFSTLGTALVVDGRAALVSRFSASTFWDQVRAAGATEVGVVGAVSSILLRQEPGPTDRDHRVRMMHGAAGIPMDRRADFEAAVRPAAGDRLRHDRDRPLLDHEPRRPDALPGLGAGPCPSTRWPCWTLTTTRCPPALSANWWCGPASPV